MKLIKLITTLDLHKRYKVYVCNMGKTRSLALNRYLFGVVYKKIKDLTGIEVEKIHEMMKAKFGLRVQEFLCEGEMIEYMMSTKMLTNSQFIEFIEKIRQWALHKLELRIPQPNEISDEDAIFAYEEAF